MAVRQFTAEQKLECLRRELRFRKRVYARKVEQGDMKAEFANEQIALVEAMIADYEALAANERLI